jgi:hypothetical protein
MTLELIRGKMKIFYLMILVLMLSATVYHTLVLYCFDINYYYRVQNISFNFLFVAFVFLCYKKVLGKSNIKFFIFHSFILLVFLLQLQISLCDLFNFYSYYWSGDLLFLQFEDVSALEEYVIPLWSSLIETYHIRCLGDDIITNAPTSINGKKYANNANFAVNVIHGVSIGLSPPIIFKGLGGVTPLFIQTLPPMAKTVGITAMGVGGYLLVEIAKLGK